METENAKTYYSNLMVNDNKEDDESSCNENHNESLEELVTVSEKDENEVKNN
jgi:hypothetical protein